MKPRVLLTGGAGFIGSHTADALARRGFRIRILDSLEYPVHKNHWPSYFQGKDYELLRGDIRNKRLVSRALRGISYVYHFAAYQDQRPDFAKFFEVNTAGAALLYEVILEQHLRVKKIVAASSQFVYGDGFYRCEHSKESFRPELRTLEQFKKNRWDIMCPHGGPARFLPFREDQPVNPTNSYGLSKHALENLALRLGKTYRIPTTILRYSIVQGPRQSPWNVYSGALRIFVSEALAGAPITVYEDGLQTRDFVDVRDVVRANLTALTHPKANFEIFNVGGGRAHRVINFAKLVKRIAKSPSPILVGSFRRTDTRHAVSDIQKLKKLGWSPRHTPRESLESYLRWYRSEGFEGGVSKRVLTALSRGVPL